MNYQENKKSIRILLILLLIHGGLVATHLGEFWPFSIFPMFSQAGNPWTRALARDVSAETSTEWDQKPIAQLPGATFAFDEVGINTNDVANYLQKAGQWDEQKIQGIRTLFGSEVNRRNIMLYRVQGKLTHNDSVSVLAQPFLYMTSDTTILNPDIKRSK